MVSCRYADQAVETWRPPQLAEGVLGGHSLGSISKRSTSFWGVIAVQRKDRTATGKQCAPCLICPTHAPALPDNSVFQSCAISLPPLPIMSGALAGRPGLTVAQSPKLSTLPASRRANGAQRTGCRVRKLQVEACHRCLARQLVSPPQLQRGVASGGTVRGPAAPAALPEAPQQQGAERRALNNQQQQQGGTGPQQEQTAGVQPPEPAEQQGQEQEQEQSAGVAAALAMLRFYKSAISPLLPPACRFLPTCSGWWVLSA